MKNKILLTILIGFVFWLQNTAAQNNLYKEIEEVKRSENSFEKINAFQIIRQSSIPKILNNFNNKNEVVFLKYNPKEFRNGAKFINLEIPLLNRKNLNLELVQIENCYNYKITTDKEMSYKPNKAIKHYRGVVAEIPNSLATFTFFENKVMGVIATDKGNFNLIFDKNTKKHILYNDQNLSKKLPFKCSTISDDDFVGYSSEILFATEKSRKERSINFTQKYVRLYYETEYDIYTFWGSNITSVEAFITGLYNQVATLYRNENIFTELSEIKIWTTPDPYTAVSSKKLLAQFQNHTTSINGDLGQLLTFRSVGGGLSASINGLCRASVNDKLSVAGIHSYFGYFPCYSWTVALSTHEFGHLLGSRHTHACVWNGNNTAIDGCYKTEGGCALPPIPPAGGTIMSYCDINPMGSINFNLGFGPQPGNVIRNSVSNAWCLPYYGIIGYSAICNQETYTIANHPTGETVQWSTSNNKLQLLSEQGAETAVFKKSGTGECTIKAQLIGLNIELTKTVFVGIPHFEISCVAEFGNSTAAFFASPTNYSEKWASIPMDYEWSYSDGNQNVVVGYYPNASFADIQPIITFPHSGYYTISMKAILNDCYIPVATIQYYCPPNMRHTYFISPNGDGINDVWEIIDTTKPDTETVKDRTQKPLVYNVSIFNSEGHIVYQKDKYMQDKERFYGVGNYGKYNGKTLPAGDYFFTITGSIAASGHIYIKRE